MPTRSINELTLRLQIMVPVSLLKWRLLPENLKTPGNDVKMFLVFPTVIESMFSRPVNRRLLTILHLIVSTRLLH